MINPPNECPSKTGGNVSFFWMKSATSPACVYCRFENEYEIRKAF
jgi:hypothetical protein